MNIKASRLCLSVAVASLCACSSPPYAALSIEDDAELTSNVVVADSALRDVIRVGRPAVERVPGTNQLKVAVPIRNIGDEPIQVLAQMEFQNAQRESVDDDTNQQVKLIGPGSTQTHVVISKRDAAREWVLRISWNR